MSRQLQLARGEAQLPNNRVLSYVCGTGDLPPQPYKGRGAVEVVAAVDIMAKEPWFVSDGLLPTIHCVARLSRSVCLQSTSPGMIHAGMLTMPGYLL